MVQTHWTINGPQTSQSQQQGGDGNLLVLPRVDNLIPLTIQGRGPVYSNYNDASVAADDS